MKKTVNLVTGEVIEELNRYSECDKVTGHGYYAIVYGDDGTIRGVCKKCYQQRYQQHLWVLCIVGGY
jgi:hypothetical protein